MPVSAADAVSRRSLMLLRCPFVYFALLPQAGSAQDYDAVIILPSLYCRVICSSYMKIGFDKIISAI